MSPEPPHGRRWLLTGFALSAFGSMLFAGKSILVKLVYVHHVDSTTLVTLRMALAMPIFVAVGWHDWRRRPAELRPDRQTIGLAMLVGILGYYVSSWLDFEGLETVGAQQERLILFTYPFLVILFGRVLLGHPLRPHALAGAGLSYLGLIAMFGLEPVRLTPPVLTGSALIMASAGTFAFYQLFAREMIVRCGAALFTAIAMTAAGFAMFAHFLATHELSALAIPVPAWPSIFILALVATVAASFAMSAGTARIGAQGTAIIATLSPAVTIILAVAILGEPFGLPEAIGTVCVLGGVGLFSLIEARATAR